MIDRLGYLERFLDAVDDVERGRLGSISENRWLIINYKTDFLQAIEKYLSSPDDRVVSETISLLTAVGERAVASVISDLRISGSERVRLSALGYQMHMDDNDKSIPRLFDTLEHCNGQEFDLAARRMQAIARESDIPHLRSIYGQVEGDMRTKMKLVIEAVIERNPSLRPKRDLILSIPVYPDEGAFEAFLDKSMDYIDVRYRNNIESRGRVPLKTYNNVATALKTMRTRLYNESDNLQYYGPDKTDRFYELTKLIRWASADLSGKEVEMPDRRVNRMCPGCGSPMCCFKGMWSCPDCGSV